MNVLSSHIRHELVSPALKALAFMLHARPTSPLPGPPASPALVTLLQAYTGASDEEALEALRMDRRCLLLISMP